MKWVQSREARSNHKQVREGTKVLIHWWFAFRLKRRRMFDASVVYSPNLSQDFLRPVFLLALSLQLGQMAEGQLQRSQAQPTTPQPGPSPMQPAQSTAPAITNPQQVPCDPRVTAGPSALSLGQGITLASATH